MSESTLSKSPLWNSQILREIDRASIDTFLIPGIVLMEHAAKACAMVIREKIKPSPVAILVGPGNNGGDGLSLARWLFEYGYDVAVFMVSHRQPAKLSALCEQQLGLVKKLNINCSAYAPGCLQSWHNETGHQCCTIIDAVLGSGISGKIKAGPVSDALNEARSMTNKYVIAIDCLSGLGMDITDQMPPLSADITVTFGSLKQSQVVAPSRDACGEVVCLDIGFSSQAIANVLKANSPLMWLANPNYWLRDSLEKKLSPSSHKFDRGHVLVVGGSPGKMGAQSLAASAAIQCGAGWVTLSSRTASLTTPTNAIGAPSDQFTTEHLYNGDTLCESKLERFIRSRSVNALVIGPGWIKNEINEPMLATLAALQKETGLFIVFDAGATKGLGGLLSKAPLNPKLTVITPHPGEWSRLEGGAPKAISSEKDLKTAIACAKSWGVTAIYKSATPMVVDPVSGDVVVTTHGDNRLAKAGSGDILTGILATHGARKFNGPEAAIRSLIIMASAARSATIGRGSSTLSTEKLTDHIGHWI